ncbi:MAG: hypothetical protein L0G70_06720 [Rubrobacter sp.]|nr:hypothetical protein [Rubrobacter sp.]
MEDQKTWTNEEAMSNLESLTRLRWSREELSEGVRELLQTYEAAIPQMAAEIRGLRGELEKGQGEASDQSSEGEGSNAPDAYEDLAEFARRLGLDQR